MTVLTYDIRYMVLLVHSVPDSLRQKIWTLQGKCRELLLQPLVHDHRELLPSERSALPRLEPPTSDSPTRCGRTSLNSSSFIRPGS